MANLITISVNWGICPICLYNALETRGIDTFSSEKKMSEILEFAEMPQARNPFETNEGTFGYFCENHSFDTLDNVNYENYDLNF